MDYNIVLMLTALFLSMIILMALGVPLAFALGGLGLLFLLIFMGPKALYSSVAETWSTMQNFILVAIPLFILMANLLQESGIAEDLFRMVHLWSGRLPGGLAIGTVFICTIFAAMSGLSGPSTVTMGVVALPSMLKRGYDKSLSMGTIMAGGALGILIPPSIVMIEFGFFGRVSVGSLFMAGIVPGLLLASMFTAYIIIRCYLNPQLGPPVPPDMGATSREKWASLRAVILPIMLVILVLGSIYTGICTPTEASAIGAAGALLIPLLRRRLSFAALRAALVRTVSLTGMVFWVFVGALVFTAFYGQLGVLERLMQWIKLSQISPWFIILGAQLLLFILGCFMDPGGIIVLTVPLFAPIIKGLGFDPIWFGVLYVMNMEMAYLTPPFGMNLFFLKGVAPENITMGDIYKSALPFISIQAIALAIVMIFPKIALWLPQLMQKTM
jgi:tripartite ATP-independent transporter DctM subunit